ncbi:MULTISPECIES: hypothetical protein [unclassified Streptomyces]|uniref:hypothetical protein n=1 Tax=unclassified Streptomyces TaxID=2593676 RepID=UPI002E164C35|nr:hypothetical protein OG452_25900 [Streptomyces sp. NBC_01197]WSS48810.1 hypothetical protein OG708_09170 [Streptomyces sp. NBC_01180]
MSAARRIATASTIAALAFTGLAAGAATGAERPAAGPVEVTRTVAAGDGTSIGWDSATPQASKAPANKSSIGWD